MGRNLDMDEWLGEILARRDLSKRQRRMATEIQDQMAVGALPNMARVRALQRALQPAPDCARMGEDGSCGWLRRYGERSGMPVPPVGQKAMCPWTTLNLRTKCAGYKRAR